MVMVLGLVACAPEETPVGATITIAGLSFGEPVTIEAGATLVIRNDDTLPHTWTATDGSFDSGNLDPGAQFTRVFTEPGEYPFVCELHPTMTGTVTVTG
ncbi:MAG TPA: cupredoxin domain-containing protein [Acidimicrobiia bacterium]|nr:cupredoxin domain-containing protein [Acidimicrobiia bacterium]